MAVHDYRNRICPLLVAVCRDDDVVSEAGSISAVFKLKFSILKILETTKILLGTCWILKLQTSWLTQGYGMFSS